MGDRVRFVDEAGNEGPWIDREDVVELDNYFSKRLTGDWHGSMYATERIRAALPSKPWEPSDEMIEAEGLARGWQDTPVNTRVIVERLQRLHKAGLFAAWDRMQEADREA